MKARRLLFLIAYLITTLPLSRSAEPSAYSVKVNRSCEELAQKFYHYLDESKLIPNLVFRKTEHGAYSYEQEGLKGNHLTLGCSVIDFFEERDVVRALLYSYGTEAETWTKYVSDFLKKSDIYFDESASTTPTSIDFFIFPEFKISDFYKEAKPKGGTISVGPHEYAITSGKDTNHQIYWQRTDRNEALIYLYDPDEHLLGVGSALGMFVDNVYQKMRDALLREGAQNFVYGFLPSESTHTVKPPADSGVSEADSESLNNLVAEGMAGKFIEYDLKKRNLIFTRVALSNHMLFDARTGEITTLFDGYVLPPEQTDLSLKLRRTSRTELLQDMHNMGSGICVYYLNKKIIHPEGLPEAAVMQAPGSSASWFNPFKLFRRFFGNKQKT